MDMVLYGSGPGDDRVILLGCAKLLDGLAWADLWLADGAFKVVRRTGTEVLNQRQLVHYILSTSYISSIKRRPLKSRRVICRSD